jgi:hypothetical protein
MMSGVSVFGMFSVMAVMITVLGGVVVTVVLVGVAMSLGGVSDFSGRSFVSSRGVGTRNGCSESWGSGKKSCESSREAHVGSNLKGVKKSRIEEKRGLS